MPGRPDFNPRAPCGARLITTAISSPHQQFQSTRPVWGATNSVGAPVSEPIFQSTRPVWGATFRLRVENVRYSISIHAPRVGRDYCQPSIRSQIRYFNPRAPCGARLYKAYKSRRANGISIHAPRVGRDNMSPIRNTRSFISIHAPRVGRDSTAFRFLQQNPHFNPRAPCGARPPNERRKREWINFNPRAPCGARRIYSFPRCSALGFQSTRPVWGATQQRKDFFAKSLFQSTRPVWGATANLTILPRQICTKGTKEFLLGRKTHGEKEK